MLAGDTEVNASTGKSDFTGSGNPKGIQWKLQKAAPQKGIQGSWITEDLENSSLLTYS